MSQDQNQIVDTMAAGLIHESKKHSGAWFIWLWVSGCLIILAVLAHTQAPLVALNCPYNENNIDRRATPENCAPFHILAIRSGAELLSASRQIIHRNRDDITALSTVIVAIFTGTLWWVTSRMVGIAMVQREDMLRVISTASEANVISRENLTSAQRPWLRARIQIIEPLKWTGETECSIGFRVSIQNVGRSPAVEVYVSTHLILLPHERLGDIAERQKRSGYAARGWQLPDSKEVVFPGDDADIPRMMMARFEPTNPAEANAVKLVLIVCVDYKFPFSDGHHQTWLCCEVRMRGHASRLISYRDGDLATDDLVLQSPIGALFYAD